MTMTTAPQLTMPSSADEALERDFRGAMRRLASGVALVTTADEGGQRYGIAMTAVMSLSMEPPSLLLAINRTASLCKPVLDRGIFGVNILARDDEQSCQSFVTTPAAERFNHGAWTAHESGIPLLGTALAAMVCRLDKAEAFGSHMVIRGLVDYVALHESSDALVYLDGRYGGLTAGK
jgi:flavin reductase (DIM6/NTAB) family NADH-FMN oxidoreductase RutF